VWAKVGVPIGRLDQALNDAKLAGRELSYPLGQMVKDAAVLEDATRRLAAGAPKVSAMVEELDALVAQGQAAAPLSVDEIEDEIWIKWIADLGHAGAAILDEDYPGGVPYRARDLRPAGYRYRTVVLGR
jgi:hypothetical protein